MFYVGIDPGVTLAGLVIKDEEGNILAAETFTANKKDHNFHSMTRCSHISLSILDRVEEIVGDGGVAIGIETPVYKRNPKTFAIQWAMVSMLVDRALEGHAYVVLPNPTEAKLAHTGSGAADKLDMICAGSFDGPGWGTDDDQEALADAEAMCNYAKNHLGKALPFPQDNKASSPVFTAPL